MQKDVLNINARAVLDMLRASKYHPTALEVYEVVRQTRPRIGLATVYRVLHQLTKQGLIKELGHRDESIHYDACTYRHDHAVCTQCGALLDIPIEVSVSNDMLQAAAQATGIELDSHELRIYGRCSACQRSNT